MKFIIAFMFVFFAASTALAQSGVENLGKSTPTGCKVAWVDMGNNILACPSPKEDGVGSVTVKKTNGVITVAADVFNYPSNTTAKLKGIKAKIRLIESKCSTVETSIFKCGGFIVGVTVDDKSVYIMYSKAGE